MSTSPTAIIIGAGPSGIALAYKLKHKLGFNDFTIYDKLDGVGGTWRANTYPGCGSDVPVHLYSFSFNLNPHWSKELCDQAEILEYMENTVDTFDLRCHMHTSVECTGAKWNTSTSQWDVELFDLQTEVSYIRTATVFVSCVGGISFPRNVKFKGDEKFTGKMFHTARWDHSANYENKRIAVIGNGCSAAQVLPQLAKKAAFVKQYARSAQWYHDRPNRKFTEFEKWMFKYVPFKMRWLRLKIFMENDASTATYLGTDSGVKARLRAEAESKNYIYGKTPKRYHDMIVPTFQLGCKRRIFDPEYLDALHNENVELVAEGIRELTETGIVSTGGKADDFDIIIQATGFQVSQFLTPMKIIGKTGVSLNQQWIESRGAQAYLGTYVHNFPNLAIIFGPNVFPANNSALFACEVQVDYAIKTLFTPILDGRASTIEIKRSAEDRETNKIHHQLRNSVFAAACSNWYIGDFGRNAASWPDTAASFWAKTLIPSWSAFEIQGGKMTWWLHAIARNARMHGAELLSAGLAIGVLMKATKSGVPESLLSEISRLRS